MAAHGRDVHLGGVFLPVFQRKGHAVVLLPDVQGADVRVLIPQAEPDRVDMLRQLRGPQERVIPIEHQRGTVGQALADLQLGLADILLAAQVANVRHTDAGDDAHIRAGAAAQPLDLAPVAHAHLHHRVLRLFADAEHGAGQAQLVVLVALGLDGIAKARNGGVGHLFGSGLAHAARHAHYLGGKLAAVVGTHHHHGAVAVRAEKTLPRRDIFHRVVEDDIFGPLFQCFGREIVAVKFFTGERHKDAPGAHLAAVGGHKVDGCLIGKALRGQAF